MFLFISSYRYNTNELILMLKKKVEQMQNNKVVAWSEKRCLYEVSSDSASRAVSDSSYHFCIYLIILLQPSTMGERRKRGECKTQSLEEL